MTVLEVRDLGKAYCKYSSELRRISSWFGFSPGKSEKHWVLRDISFSLETGDSLAIIGQNGAGKSTLLKLIAGVQKPTEGEINVRGRVAAILELGLGFNPELTGSQNAVNGLGLWGYSREHIIRVLPEVRAFADIGEYFDRPSRTYSSGMQTRLAFAVATAFRPDILIVDEALSVGDAQFQAKCYKRIQNYISMGTSLMLVTHSISDVLRHCSRALLIDEGKLEVDGAPRDVVNLYLDRRSTALNPESANLPSTENSSRKAYLEDVFSTRPGYQKDEHRWNAIGAKILDFQIKSNGTEYPQFVENHALVEIRFKVLFEGAFDNVVPGILVKTVDGFYVYGTNSLSAGESQEMIGVKGGEVLFFRFLLRLQLAGGAYLLSLGVSAGTNSSDLTPLDRRYDSILINVSRSDVLTGLVDLQANFSVESGLTPNEFRQQ